ncbi:MAG: GNAT family N-acetyltransferase [Paraprevotella sp.]|nr:GNAT family N-acetyltransferase [Paraprevotella sp.]
MVVTENIHLRALEPEDLEWLYRLDNDERIWEYGLSNVPYSRYVLKTYLETLRNDIYQDGQLRMAVTLSDEKTVIGCVDLVNFSPRHLRAEIGIVIFPEYRRRGYASRVLQKLLSYARDFLFLHQVYAVVSEKNKAALGLFVKSGFEGGATLTDWLRDERECYVPARVFSMLL